MILLAARGKEQKIRKFSWANHGKQRTLFLESKGFIPPSESRALSAEPGPVMYAEGGMYRPDAGDTLQFYPEVASVTAGAYPEVSEYDEQKPRLLLMGLRSRVPQVVRERYAFPGKYQQAAEGYTCRRALCEPAELRHCWTSVYSCCRSFTPPLTRLVVGRSFLEFGVWDFPGPVDYHDPEYVPSRIFAQSGALIYVIDAQDDYVDALANLHSTITQAHRVNPNLLFEVFIHKVDGLSDDYKIDTQRDIQMRMADELAEMGLED
ncbi:MAG: Gtr1/RagA G protein conserved region-domain-containing protein, partial [Olpidium bornovanus]